MKKFYILLFIIFQLSCLNFKKPLPADLKEERTSVDVLITLGFNKKNAEVDTETCVFLKNSLKQTLISFSNAKNNFPKYNFLTSKKEGNAPLLLEIDLSGYGKIKKEWVSFLFKMGLIEALSQGLIVYGATHNLWVSWGVAGEEVLSEYLTWYGGSSLFGSVYEPVTIEGRLIDKRDNKILWRKIVVVTKSKKELKKFGKEKRKNKKIILKANFEKAKKEIFKDWLGYLKDNF